MTQRKSGQTSKPIYQGGFNVLQFSIGNTYISLALLRFLSGSVPKKLSASKSEIHPHDIKKFIFQCAETHSSISKI
jgi:hypothetical protein